MKLKDDYKKEKYQNAIMIITNLLQNYYSEMENLLLTGV
jgi:hypothetical protein